MWSEKFILFIYVACVSLRYKICSWLAIIFCAQSLANMRNLENDLKQISMAMMYVPFHSFFLLIFKLRVPKALNSEMNLSIPVKIQHGSDLS